MQNKKHGTFFTYKYKFIKIFKYIFSLLNSFYFALYENDVHNMFIYFWPGYL